MGSKRLGFVTAEFGGELCGLKKAGFVTTEFCGGTERAQKGWGS